MKKSPNKPAQTLVEVQYFRSLIALIVVLAILFRWAISIGPYSGQSKPPMFGDYEAHRHWMEITYNLPITEWYHNSSNNDLQYWGLDYPPLTAYHSLVLGYFANKINSSWIELKKSAGLESYDSKFFMRSTVSLSDLCTLLPALVLFSVYFMKPTTTITCLEYLVVTLFYPGFLLIDHGHFQYNCVSLGLFLAAVMLIFKRHEILASICFVLALNHKQMELYHALPIFAYLFGSCIKLPTSTGLLKFLKLSLAVIFTFLLVWWPFLRSFDSFVQVLIRVFPLARGIYEDKVANIWCSMSILIKWKSFFTNQQMALISSMTTLVTCSPSILMLIARPSTKQLKYALLVSSLTFFLFSFQVHEKTILLAALPALLVYDEDPVICGLFLMTSVLSLFPLAVKDEMETSFFALHLAYYVWLTDVNHSVDSTDIKYGLFTHKFITTYVFHASFAIGILLSLSGVLFDPPARYPDLFTLLNVVYCSGHFCLILLYFYLRQYHIYLGLSSKVDVDLKRKKIK